MNYCVFQFDKLKLHLTKEHLDMTQGLQQKVYEGVIVACKLLYCRNVKITLLTVITVLLRGGFSINYSSRQLSDNEKKVL